MGSGTVERAWKHLVGARLALAGMIWDVPGAEAVAVVRAWRKRGRLALGMFLAGSVVRAWRKRDRRDDALRLRPPPRRRYRRQAAAATVA
jgi:hypothetical protein